MLYKIYRIPAAVLFLISIFPILSGDVSPKLWACLNIFVFIFFSLWAFSITKVLVSKNHYDQEIKFGKFKTILALINIYITSLLIYVGLTFNKTEEPKWLVLVVIIGNLFLFYGIFFTIRFIAKAISTIETKRAVTFTDYAGYFFLLLFFPFGIWWLTPKIQSLANT